MYSTWSVLQLKDALRKRKAPITGKKAALIERLEAYDRNDLIGVEDELDDEIPDFPALDKFRDVNASTNIPALSKHHIQEFADRTEYWKSQARKYCEFCKCWFADNKVSISFHESGKRHKENVQKHISQLSKRSAKDFKQKEKMDDDIKKMEAAAMAAYLKDVQNNADLTSQSINDMLGQSSSQDAPTIVIADAQKEKSKPVWQEIKNDDGSSYYWNTVTNETTWDTPDEYISIAEQEEKALKKKAASEKKKDKLLKEKQKEAIREVKAHVAREKMRERAAPQEAPVAPAAVDYGPSPRALKPYGSWTPVVAEPVQNVDLQLPKVEEPPPPPVVMEPETFKFKEKRIDSLGDGPVEFKKRKFNNPKRNIRQKLDDE